MKNDLLCMVYIEVHFMCLDFPFCFQDLLDPSYSSCCPWTSSINISRKLVRNADSPAPHPQPIPPVSAFSQHPYVIRVYTKV